MLNPATLLPTEMGVLEHDCIETTNTIYSSLPDLGSEPLPNIQEECFIEGSSFMREGKKPGLAGYAVTPRLKSQGMKPTPRDFCPKDGADSPHLILLELTRKLSTSLCPYILK